MMVKKPKKLRIGILCDSQKVNNFYFQLAKDIKENQFVEETFFITGYPTKNNSNDKIVGKSSVLARFNKAFKNFLFSQIKKIIYKVESKYVKANYPDYFGRGDLLQIGIKQIKVEGKLSKNGLFLEFDQKSLLELDSLNFDLILRTGTGILKGNILNIPKYGIISFHHGDNSFLYRGGPCGFWEIYNKSDFTGFIIQKLSSELDGGDVLYRGITLTKPLWMLNKAHIKEKSRPIFMQIIENLSKGIEINKPTSKLYSGPVNRLNNNPFFLLKYILNNYPSFFIKLIRRRIKIPKYPNRWSIAFLNKFDLNVPLLRYKEIENRPFSFFADPFVITYKEKTIIFCEEYSLLTRKGVISAIAIEDNKYSYLGPVLEENFHLSFPFVFQHGNDIYMVPESGKNKQIRLYKCIEFPKKWKLEQILMDKVNAADSFLVEKEGKWFLFSNICSGSTPDHDSELHIFYANHFLTDEWKSIKSGNPVIFDANFARNGGMFFINDKLHRISQKTINKIYGRQFQINKIEILSDQTYKEVPLYEVYPNFKNDLLGTHHFHSNGKYAVVDYCKRWNN